MELAVKSIDGKDTGEKITLADSIFGVEPSQQAIYLDVKLILAHARQGTHKTKDRSEVAGSTRKLYRQKGTGNARRGAIRSNLLRKGGTVFGPKPHKYGFKLNKKVKKLARASALSLKVKESAITVVENFTFATPKTKEFARVLTNLQLSQAKALVVTAGSDNKVYLAGRNLPNVAIVAVQELNTYSILNADKLLMMKDAVNYINANFAAEK